MSLLNLAPKWKKISSTSYCVGPTLMPCCPLHGLSLSSLYSLPPFQYPVSHHGRSKNRSRNTDDNLLTGGSSLSPSPIILSFVVEYDAAPGPTSTAFSSMSHRLIQGSLALWSLFGFVLFAYAPCPAASVVSWRYQTRTVSYQERSIGRLPPQLQHCCCC